MNKLSLFLCLSAIGTHVSISSLPKEGFVAPQIELTEIVEEFVDISYFKGQKIALIFLPTTMGWKKELRSITKAQNSLKAAGIIPICISTDSRDNLLNFVQKNELPFPIFHVSHNAIKAYEVNGLLGGVKRYTFLINENGVITKIITHVNKRNHAQQIIDGFAQLK